MLSGVFVCGCLQDIVLILPASVMCSIFSFSIDSLLCISYYLGCILVLLSLGGVAIASSLEKTASSFGSAVENMFPKTVILAIHSSAMTVLGIKVGPFSVCTKGKSTDTSIWERASIHLKALACFFPHIVSLS
jgi:hypothetical protein